MRKAQRKVVCLHCFCLCEIFVVKGVWHIELQSKYWFDICADCWSESWSVNFPHVNRKPEALLSCISSRIWLCSSISLDISLPVASSYLFFVLFVSQQRGRGFRIDGLMTGWQMEPQLPIISFLSFFFLNHLTVCHMSDSLWLCRPTWWRTDRQSGLSWPSWQPWNTRETG